jgi:hypothetical protein
MNKFRNVDKNLPNGRILSKPSSSVPLYQLPIEEEDNELKLALLTYFCSANRRN